MALTLQDSRMSSFVATAAATQRTVAAKLGDVVSVKDFGAKGDGSANDTAAFQAALNEIAGRTYGGCLYIPAGRYKLTGVVTFTAGKPLSIIGDGPSVSTLLCASSSSGLRIAPSVATALFTAYGFGFVPATIIGTPALDIEFPPLGSDAQRVSIDSVQVMPQDNANYFAAGFKLKWCSNSTITNCTLFGHIGVRPTIGAANGILLADGYIAGSAVFADVFISQCRLIFWQNAIHANGYVEGVQIHQCKIEYSDYGIAKTKVGSGAEEPPHFVVTDTHVNARKRAIFLGAVKSYFLTNLLLYCRADAGMGIGPGSSIGLTDYAFIEVQGAPIGDSDNEIGTQSAQSVIQGINAYAELGVLNNAPINDKGAIQGIVVQDERLLTISNCTMNNMNTAYWLQSNAKKCAVLDWKAINCTIDIQNDGGDQNHTRHFRRRYAVVRNNANQAIPNTTDTKVQWDAPEVTSSSDDFDLWGLSSDGLDRFTIPAGKGIRAVRLSTRIVWAPNNTGGRTILIRRNGTDVIASDRRTSADNTDAVLSTPIIQANPGDFFEVFVIQNSGGGLNVSAGSSFTVEVIE